MATEEEKPKIIKRAVTFKEISETIPEPKLNKNVPEDGIFFKQDTQSLPSCIPWFESPKIVLPLFFITGVVFIGIGAGMFWFSSTEIVHDYTNCKNENDEFCHDIITNMTDQREYPNS